MVLLLCNIQGVNTTRSHNIQHKFSVSKVYKKQTWFKLKIMEVN